MGSCGITGPGGLMGAHADRWVSPPLVPPPSPSPPLPLRPVPSRPVLTGWAMLGLCVYLYWPKGDPSVRSHESWCVMRLIILTLYVVPNKRETIQLG